LDFEQIRELLGGRCFICEMLAGNSDYEHAVVYEDDSAVAFLNRYPTLYGYVLVAPKQHREQVTGISRFGSTSISRLSSIASARRFGGWCRPSAFTCSASAASKRTATSIGISPLRHRACRLSDSNLLHSTPTPWSISVRPTRLI
jgi:hypothetical protein